MAEEKGLDVVEISPDKVPPVCKLMDYGKYKYEQQKKAKQERKKQKVIEDQGDQDAPHHRRS